MLEITTPMMLDHLSARSSPCSQRNHAQLASIATVAPMKNTDRQLMVDSMTREALSSAYEKFSELVA
ncbi:hypothetical protein AMK34_01115 [Amycolatopsis sp. CB00013]|nr:hypothetical protein AMK34_01115 [Amycolatopsis sp. CB00013]